MLLEIWVIHHFTLEQRIRPPEPPPVPLPPVLVLDTPKSGGAATAAAAATWEVMVAEVPPVRGAAKRNPLDDWNSGGAACGLVATRGVFPDIVPKLKPPTTAGAGWGNALVAGPAVAAVESVLAVLDT
jgi:hypothetical protein